MALQQIGQLSIADLSANKRKCKNTFFDQINEIVPWSKVNKLLKEIYPKGKTSSGRQAYDPLVLFKMLLLQTWYGLSDYQIEEEVNDRITFSKFCNLSMDSDVPDHSVLSRFRTMLTNKNALESLLSLINTQLNIKGVLVQQGIIVDASITPTPRKPKGKKAYSLHEEENTTLSESCQKGVDQEASWTKKGGKIYYGYKRHIAVDANHGLVLTVASTKASLSDSKEMDNLLAKIPLNPGNRVYADKGYSGNPNEEILRNRGLRSAIQKKGSRNKALNSYEKRFNKIISKTRYKVERVFGSIKMWFKSDKTRYIGLAKTHTQHIMEAIAYNLYRAPNIILRYYVG